MKSLKIIRILCVLTMHQVGFTSGLPSGSTLDKPLQIMKRWYWKWSPRLVKHTDNISLLTSFMLLWIVTKTTQSPANVSDYCGVLQLA